MTKILKTILKIINGVILSVTILLAITILTARFMGIQLYTVLSGSMEPEYPTGSLIVVKEIEPSELKEGDVITFRLNANTTATHRIVEIISEGNNLKFRTKGDANEEADGSPVSEEYVVGTPFLTFPEAGYTANKLQSPEGKKKIITVFAVLMAYVFVTDFFISDKKSKKKDASETNDKS